VIDTETTEPPVPEHEGSVTTRAWVENRPARRRLIPRYNVRELWSFRDVGLILAQRDLKVRYKQTFFGVTWALLQPLVAMVLFTLVLGSSGADLPSQGLPYSAFVLVGLAVWFPFNTALTASADSLTQNPQLVTKVYFPRLLAPLGAILAPVLDLAIATAVALVVAVIAGVPLRATTPLVLVGAVWFTAIALGFGAWLSALNLLYRDVRYALGFITQILFFVSPVVYPSTLTDGTVQTILAVNPLVGLIEFFRWAMLGAPADTQTLLTSLAGTVLLLAVGLLFFQNMERRFADRI
jgi:lipopolysaccharide transport system permease protein